MLRNLKNNQLLKNTLIYTLTDGINKGISFALVPLVSYYLLPEELGVVTNFQVLFNILILLSGQVIVNSMPYFFYGKEKKYVTLFVSNLIFLVLIFNFLFFVITLLVYPIVFNYLQIGFSIQLFALLTVVGTLFANLNLILLRLEENVKAFAFIQILQTFVNVLFVVVLVIVLQLGASGKIYSILFTAFIMGAINGILLYNRGYLTFSIDFTIIKDLLSFSLPLLPHSLSFWLKNGVDKILITIYCGLSVNGLYSMALNLTAVYVVFLTSFENAYCPYLQKRISLFTADTIAIEKKSIVKQVYLLALFSIFLWGLALGFIWFCIEYIIDKSYADSFRYVFWLLMAQLFNGFYKLVVQYIYNVKKTFGLGIITFSGSVFQVYLSYVLVQIFGAIGVAFSSFVGAVVIFILVWLYSNKVYPMPWFNFQRSNN